MRLAEKTEDDDLLRCAATHALSYQKQRELFGSPTDDAIGTAIYSFLQRAIATVQKHAIERCTQKHDPLAIPDVVAGARQAALLGGDSIDVLTVLSQCPSDPVLNFQSELSATDKLTLTTVPPGVSTKTDYDIDFTVAAMFHLQGMVTQNSLNGTGDGYLAYQLSGSDALTYKKYSGTGSFIQVVDHPPNTLSCSFVVTDTRGSTLKVVPKSEIKYQATATFNPKAVRKNGKLLCDFCPANQIATGFGHLDSRPRDASGNLNKSMQYR
jgi:hypothetical protein